MCGVAGKVYFNRERKVLEESLHEMTDIMKHRGPDGFGLYINGNTGYAMRRLTIIDLETGNQPVFNEDGSVAVIQNGEIYNYKGLREELIGKGHKFSTVSDTEVIVHSYEEWGNDCPKH